MLPLLGVTTTGDRLVMVTEWMANGNINEFLKANINADRLELVCLSRLSPRLRLLLTITYLLQLRDVTKGLIYMHDQGIIHGNLKGVRFRTPCQPHAYALPFLRRTS